MEKGVFQLETREWCSRRSKENIRHGGGASEQIGIHSCSIRLCDVLSGTSLVSSSESEAAAIEIIGRKTTEKVQASAG